MGNKCYKSYYPAFSRQVAPHSAYLFTLKSTPYKGMSIIGYKKATKQYTKQRDDMISLEAGDIIEQLSQPANGWAKGKNLRTGLTGWFPFAQTVDSTLKEAEEFKSTAKDDEDEGYYEDYYEEEEDEEEKPQAKAAAKPAAAQPTQQAAVDNAELEKVKKQLSTLTEQYNKLKETATIENIINFQVSEIENQVQLRVENGELKQLVLQLEQQLVEQKAVCEQLSVKNKKLEVQVKQFESQEAKLLSYEEEKSQLLQQTQNKLKEKELQLQNLELLIQASGLGSDIANSFQTAQTEKNALEMENFKLACELDKVEAQKQNIGKFVVKKRKNPKSRQNLKIDSAAVQDKFGGQ